MRLLNAKDATLKEFIGSNIPKYAVISHRWGEKEISYQDFIEERKSLNDIESVSPDWGTNGWAKINAACRLARERDLEWVWLDTCCIDKRSSAELSEAINSMFDWYQRSESCYVFLPDVDYNAETVARADVFGEEGEGMARMRDPPTGLLPFDQDVFMKSVWFDRAWTLQELLAPNDVRFFSTSWKFLGNKNDLRPAIRQVTRIPDIFITSNDMIHKASVAERMKWASNRQATRLEDNAYSLLGLFGVNMPLLYGEGNRAFLRLQTEIIRISDDETIFGWSGKSYYHANGLLAPDLAAFSAVTDLRRQHLVPRQHYEVTNKGIRITLLLREHLLEQAFTKSAEVRVLMLLNCADYLPAYGPGEEGPSFGILVVLRRDMRGLHRDSKLRQMQPVLGDRISLRPIKSVKRTVETTNENGDTYWVVRGNDGSMGFCDLVSPAIEEDAINVPVYFSTGW
ncbi:hypothetical protein LTR09_005674 [Extremus antarcticus]|uniref:Heterokaryon incompatibility domain-containing protein n=1 Tax=Extremus antarcticus TaxID=702011 RepID=A0AAJ0DM63_9PEZI|nr:hypothetical protein LTR09_005674 [Extremus antarcticus]